MEKGRYSRRRVGVSVIAVPRHSNRSLGALVGDVPVDSNASIANDVLDELRGVGGAGGATLGLARGRELVGRDVLVATLGDVAEGLGEGLRADARAAGARVAVLGDPGQALAAAGAVAELGVPGHDSGGEEGEEGGFGVHFCFCVWGLLGE